MAEASPAHRPKRTSLRPAPMGREVHMRARVSVVVVELLLTGCNANQAINPSSQPLSKIFAWAATWTTILTIPSATHKEQHGARRWR